MPTRRTRSVAQRLRYQFLDLNGNRLLDGPQELGVFRSTQGDAGGIEVDDDIQRPYSQEFSTHLEREIVERSVGTRLLRLQERAQRVGRNRSQPRWPRMTIPFPFVDVGADGVRGTGDDQS